MTQLEGGDDVKRDLEEALAADETDLVDCNAKILNEKRILKE